MDDREQLRTQTQVARRQAVTLLAELEGCLSRGEPGCRDLFKQATGQSSLEHAVEETRRLIASHDRILSELDRAQTPIVTGEALLVSRLAIGVPR
jgi:hypothetical protein